MYLTDAMIELFISMGRSLTTFNWVSDYKRHYIFS